MVKKILKLNSVYKDYYIWEQVISVLKGIDLQVKEWEFVSIMWHSGSWKSTLMNIIGLLDNPTSGEYFFDWKNVADLDSDQHSIIRGKKIWFIFQTYNLIARKSAIEQVMLPLAYQWISKIEKNKRAKEALIKVWLKDKLYNKPNELSGWEQQRVAIARAIVINPAIILADEPTGALDTKTWDDVMNIITQLYKEWKTIMLITHEQNIAKYAKRNILVKDGLVVDQL
jgi:putative ABC transport system ATP-binding protein